MLRKLRFYFCCSLRRNLTQWMKIKSVVVGFGNICVSFINCAYFPRSAFVFVNLPRCEWVPEETVRWNFHNSRLKCVLIFWQRFFYFYFICRYLIVFYLSNGLDILISWICVLCRAAIKRQRVHRHVHNKRQDTNRKQKKRQRDKI